MTKLILKSKATGQKDNINHPPFIKNLPNVPQGLFL